MDNPETLATLATQDEENTEGAINNGQSRDTGNIDHTKRRENRRGNQQWTIQRHWQHWPHKTKRILKGQSTLDNPETLATLTTQDEEKTEGALLLFAPSVFSSSCVVNVASVSGLSIVDCPFGFLFVLCGQCCQCLWIVYC
jgi:hypothetical protein